MIANSWVLENAPKGATHWCSSMRLHVKIDHHDHCYVYRKKEGGWGPLHYLATGLRSLKDIEQIEALTQEVEVLCKQREEAEDD